MGERERADGRLANTFRFLLIGLFLWLVRGILVPIVLGGVFALLMSPLHEKLARRFGEKRRKWASALLSFGLVVLVLLPLVFIVIQAVGSVDDLMERDWSKTIAGLERTAVRALDTVAGTIGMDTAKVKEEVSGGIRAAAGAVTGAAGAIAAYIPNLLLEAFLALVAFYYFLRDGTRLSGWLIRVLPFKPEETEELFSSVHNTVNGAILGSILSAAAQGTLITLLTWILGVPGPLVLGVTGFVLAFVPIFGTMPITVGCTLYFFFSGEVGRGIVMGIFAVVIGNVDNVLQPLVQSAHGKMHPLLVLLGIFGGLNAFGPAGIFIGPIIAAMAIWTIDTYAALRTRHLTGNEIQAPLPDRPPSG